MTLLATMIVGMLLSVVIYSIYLYVYTFYQHKCCVFCKFPYYYTKYFLSGSQVIEEYSLKPVVLGSLYCFKISEKRESFVSFYVLIEPI